MSRLLFPPMDPTNLAIIASDPLARAGLASRFADEADVYVTTQRGPIEADLIIQDGLVDVAVWDIGWGVADSLPDLAELMVPVLVLVAEAEDVAAAIAAGARGVLSRNADVDVLISAVNALVAGLLVLSPLYLDEVWRNRPVTPQLSLSDPLTNREQSVLSLVAEGMTNRAIAHQLSISEHTVKFHVNSIMTKLDAQSRTEAVVQATRAGLIAL